MFVSAALPTRGQRELQCVFVHVVERNGRDRLAGGRDRVGDRVGDRAVRAHPLIPDSVEVGGFLYDVDTGLLDHRV